jgi:hypothetical protein
LIGPRRNIGHGEPSAVMFRHNSTYLLRLGRGNAPRRSALNAPP